MQWTYHVYTFVYIYISLAKTFLLTKTLKYMYVCIMSIARKRLNVTIQYFVGVQARLGTSIRLAEIVQILLRLHWAQSTWYMGVHIPRTRRR